MENHLTKEQVKTAIENIDCVDSVEVLMRSGKTGKARGYVCTLAAPYTEFATLFNEIDGADAFLVLHDENWDEYKVLVLDAAYDIFWSIAFNEKFKTYLVSHLESEVVDLVRKLKRQGIIDFDEYLKADFSQALG